MKEYNTIREIIMLLSLDSKSRFNPLSLMGDFSLCKWVNYLAVKAYILKLYKMSSVLLNFSVNPFNACNIPLCS